MLGLSQLRSIYRWVLPLCLLCSAFPAIAQSTFSLSPGSQVTASGTTAGSMSLSTIRNRGTQGGFCLGYGNDVPDHTLNLQGNASRLNLSVDSNGGTTLLVQAPNGNVYCGGSNLTLSNASQGSYKIWVGSGDSGQRHRYTLSAK